MNGRVIYSQSQFDVLRSSALCANCGLPRDYDHFDESGIAPTPGIGSEVLLAHFELPPQYCGMFENFSQFTDQQMRDLSQIETPGLQWRILVNNRPLYPYIKLEHIVNPWGYGSFPVAIRLDENATVEFLVRNVSYNVSTGDRINKVGGRIVGRYWFNPAYSDATDHGCNFS
jgi:hypothetical protein